MESTLSEKDSDPHEDVKNSSGFDTPILEKGVESGAFAPKFGSDSEGATIESPPEVVADTEWLEGGRGWWVILGCFIISGITLG
jgi:hypothetical protein